MAPSPKDNNTSNNDSIQIAVMANDLKYLRNSMDTLDEKISSNYVTKAEFDPIKKVVYTLVSLILIAVVGSLLSLVVK